MNKIKFEKFNIVLVIGSILLGVLAYSLGRNSMANDVSNAYITCVESIHAEEHEFRVLVFFDKSNIADITDSQLEAYHDHLLVKCIQNQGGE